MKSTYLVFITAFSVFLVACEKHKEPSIEGLDLTKIQSSDYFRENLPAAEKLLVWCDENMNPLDTSSHETVVRNLKNCQHASSAVTITTVDIRKGRKYRSH
jgi:hypothetical protein